MTKNKKYTLCVIALCAFMVQMVLTDFKAEQSGIEIVVEDFRNVVGLNFLPFSVGSGIMNGQKMLRNGVQPIRVSIHNKSNKPIIVNKSSLPAKHVNVDSILSSSYDVKFISSLAIAYLMGAGGFILFVLEKDLCSWRTPVTTAVWVGATIAATIAPWFLYGPKKTDVNRELYSFCLYNETVIKPGYKAIKLAFLDATTYSSFFTFRVLSEDKMEFVATFDVDMLGA